MSANTETETFYREVDDKHLVPLWNITPGRQLTAEPRSPVKAHLWRWVDLRRLAYTGGRPRAHRAQAASAASWGW